MWKPAKALLAILSFLIASANLAFFVYWFNASEVRAVMPVVNPTGYTVEALALNVTILQIVLGFVGFFVAVLAFFGYNEIKRASVEAAEKEARKTMNEQIDIFRKILEMKPGTGTPEHGGTYGLGDQPVSGATPAGEE